MLTTDKTIYLRPKDAGNGERLTADIVMMCTEDRMIPYHDYPEVPPASMPLLKEFRR